MFKSNKKLQEAPNQIAKSVSDKAVDIQGDTSKHIKKYLLRRSKRMDGVKRFTVGWLFLAFVLCLTSSYAAWNLYSKSKTSASDSGGTYIEGMVGSVNNLNPLFASGSVDSSAVRLMFNGLLRYDEDGKLVSDLASSWKVEKGNKTYTVNLRKDVTWHDGRQFTSKDVLFTVNTIKNRLSRSPLYASWQGVSIKAVNDYKVQFSLPAPFAPFPGSLTLPIVPAHLLENISNENLRTTTFSNNPVGTGPFEMKILREKSGGEQIEFSANEDYHRGEPKLRRFILSTYESEQSLVSDLENREITSAVDLSAGAVSILSDNNAIRVSQMPLRDGVFAFLKTNAKPLDDSKVRRALVLATDHQAILELFNANYQPLKTPLLPSQFDGSSRFNQPTSVKEAGKLLDEAGWKLKDGVRTKGGKQLELKLVTAGSAEYSSMSEELERQWADIGVVLKVNILEQEELEQSALSAHDYNVLLYGISIGADPDVYAYWHSSQAKPGGLNFSEWKSGAADLNLELGRTRLDSRSRKVRYEAFMNEWKGAAPAVALYQPRMSYAYHQNVGGLEVFPLNISSDRLTNVEDWTVSTRSVYITP
jgi:peptide/nickel transport system substrate-binding protein